MPHNITPEAFHALAESYGSNLLRWPEAEQLHAARFAQTSEGQAILADAAALDAVLDHLKPAPPSDAFMVRILAVADAQPSMPHPAQLPATTSIRPTWVLSLLAIGILGFGFGLQPATTAQISATSVEVSDSQDTQSSLSLDSMLLGPTTLNEVIL